MPSKIAYENRIACICGIDFKNESQSKFSIVLRALDHESNLGEFDIIVCNKCGLGYTNPYPSEQTAYLLYDERDSSEFEMIKHSIIDHLNNFLSTNFLKKLCKDMNVEKVLDYSTGNGRYSIAASKAFSNSTVHSVDYHETPPSSLLQENNPNIKYFKNSFFVGGVKDKYDLIILRHVLEHTHDPISLLKYLGEHLTDNGLLYVEVPNLDSGCAKYLGKHWKGYYVPRHIMHFTPASFACVIDASGLKAKVSKCEMPLMGNTFSILTGINQHNNFVKIIGICLHPLQLAIEYFNNSSTCINAVCRNR